jgi:hypothetical protein
MQQIVPGHEDHERYYQSQSDSKTIFLGPLGQWFPPHRLNSIEQQMAAIEHWYRQQVYQAKVERKNSHEPQEGVGPPKSRVLRVPAIICPIATPVAIVTE